MNLRHFYKWTASYIRMLMLAQKRGRTWGVKHNKRFKWLRSRCQRFDEQTILDSLDKRYKR